MTSHYIDIHKPPPGLSSFTRIRLGWISPDQVVLVRPGETRGAFLAPIARGGDSLVVKIPLSRDNYYLVENRQPVGFDRVQPDSGVLIIKVDPWAQEGAGTARIMNADPRSYNFAHATFRLDSEQRRLFVDRESGIAILPLWCRGENQGVLVTTAEKSGDALKAALMIEKIWRRSHQAKGEQEGRMRQACIDAFEEYDFRRSMKIAKKILEK